MIKISDLKSFGWILIAYVTTYSLRKVWKVTSKDNDFNKIIFYFTLIILGVTLIKADDIFYNNLNDVDDDTDIDKDIYDQVTPYIPIPLEISV